MIYGLAILSYSVTLRGAVGQYLGGGGGFYFCRHRRRQGARVINFTSRLKILVVLDYYISVVWCSCLYCFEQFIGLNVCESFVVVLVASSTIG